MEEETLDPGVRGHPERARVKRRQRRHHLHVLALQALQRHLNEAAVVLEL